MRPGIEGMPTRGAAPTAPPEWPANARRHSPTYHPVRKHRLPRRVIHGLPSLPLAAYSYIACGRSVTLTQRALRDGVFTGKKPLRREGDPRNALGSRIWTDASCEADRGLFSLVPEATWGQPATVQGHPRLTAAEDRLRFLPERSLDFFNRRWLDYLGLSPTLPGSAVPRQFIHGRSRLFATREVMLPEKGGTYG